MKLQKQLSKKTREKEYFKYVAVFPPKVVKKSGFNEGEELDATAERGKIIIKKKNK